MPTQESNYRSLQLDLRVQKSAMEVQRVLHMVTGEGETSYAANSILQKTAISRAKSKLLKAITEFYCETFPHHIALADLGCSSGPNSLLVISELINTIHTLCQNIGRPSPEFQVFLNDLPGNDFNTLFKSIPPYFHKELGKDEGENFPYCSIAGVPGSFHGRLFPANTLSFVHSSYSVHWLSQVPQGISSNKGNIYIAKTSSPVVIEAYMKQFDKDFSNFLRLRSEEMISGGRMVITVVGRRSSDPSSKECCRHWELLAKSLAEMDAQGYIEEAKLDSFNLPIYYSSGTELRSIIQRQGSFRLDSLEAFDLNWDATDDPENTGFVFDKETSGENVAKCMRAITESMLASHFGMEVMDDLFKRYAEKVAEQLGDEKIKFVNLVMCMTKNAKRD